MNDPVMDGDALGVYEHPLNKELVANIIVDVGRHLAKSRRYIVLVDDLDDILEKSILKSASSSSGSSDYDGDDDVEDTEEFHEMMVEETGNPQFPVDPNFQEEYERSYSNEPQQGMRMGYGYKSSYGYGYPANPTYPRMESLTSSIGSMSFCEGGYGHAPYGHSSRYSPMEYSMN